MSLTFRSLIKFGFIAVFSMIKFQSSLIYQFIAFGFHRWFALHISPIYMFEFIYHVSVVLISTLLWLDCTEELLFLFFFSIQSWNSHTLTWQSLLLPYSWTNGTTSWTVECQRMQTCLLHCRLLLLMLSGFINFLYFQKSLHAVQRIKINHKGMRFRKELASCIVILSFVLCIRSRYLW